MDLPPHTARLLGALLRRRAFGRALTRGGVLLLLVAAVALAGAAAHRVWPIEALRIGTWALLIFAPLAASVRALAAYLAATRDPAAPRLCALRADRALDLRDRLTTTLEGLTDRPGAPMAQALARQTENLLGESGLPARVTPLGSRVRGLASSVLLWAAALLMIFFVGARHPAAGPGAPARHDSAEKPVNPDVPERKAQPPAEQETGGAAAQGQAADRTREASRRIPRPKKPSRGRPLSKKTVARRGTFEKVYVQPLFRGTPKETVRISPPRERKEPGRTERTRPRNPERSLRAFRRKAEATLRRGQYSRGDQRLVTAYFGALEKYFEKGK
jgi:hypothetical protein